jgi:hypothetical protein
LQRQPGELPRSWRARAIGLAHAVLEERGLNLREVRFGPIADDDSPVEVIVTGEPRKN